MGEDGVPGNIKICIFGGASLKGINIGAFSGTFLPSFPRLNFAYMWVVGCRAYLADGEQDNRRLSGILTLTSYHVF